MDYKLFKRLLEKFNEYTQLPGGQENPDNGWYYAAKDALVALEEEVGKYQNMDPEEFKNLGKSEEILKHLEDLQNIIQNSGSFPENEAAQVLRASLIALKAPVNCIANNLREGQSLNQSLNDSSWIEGYFADDEEIADRPDYVPGSYSIEGKSYKEIVDQYKKDFNEVGKGFDAHLKKIVNEDFDPDIMIHEKIDVIQNFVESNSLDAYDHLFLHDQIGWGYKQVRRTLNPENILLDNESQINLHSSDKVLDYNFFNLFLGQQFDHATVVSDMDLIKDFDQSLKDRLDKELNKLKFKPRKMGVSDEMIERLDKTSSVFLVLSKHWDDIHLSKGLLDADPELNQIANNFNNILSSTRDYIGNKEFASLPTEEDFINMGEQILKFSDDLSVFNDDGKASEVFAGLFTIVNDISNLSPQISDKLNPIINKILTRVKAECLNAQAQLTSKDISNKKKNNIEGAIFDFRHDQLFDPDFEFEMHYLRMAKDPEYCQKMIDEASKTIKDFAENINTSPGACYSNLFIMKRNNGVFRTAQQLYDDAYALYIMGQHIQGTRAKLEAAESGAKPIDFVKNPVDEKLVSLMKADKYDETHLDVLHQVASSIRQSNPFMAMHDAGPVSVNKTLSDEKKTLGLNTILQGNGPNIMAGYNEKFIGIMTQKSGVAFYPNSQSYQTMSDNFVAVCKKNGLPGGPTREDIVQLYKDCRNYSFSHNSSPFLDNGKLRQFSSMNMMHDLGQMLMKNLPNEEAKQFAIEVFKDDAINMARNKQYRNATQTFMQHKAAELFGKYKLESAEDWEALPLDAKHDLTQIVRTNAMIDCLNENLKKSPYCEISGKCTDVKIKSLLDAEVTKGNEVSDQAVFEMSKDPIRAIKQIKERISLTSPDNPSVPTKNDAKKHKTM